MNRRRRLFTWYDAPLFAAQAALWLLIVWVLVLGPTGFVAWAKWAGFTIGQAALTIGFVLFYRHKWLYGYCACRFCRIARGGA